LGEVLAIVQAAVLN